MRDKTIFVCQKCGSQSPRWMGRCPDCGGWNTLLEERMASEKERQDRPSYHQRPQAISDISSEGLERLSTHIEELDRVLGGGIVESSVTLIGGAPGIGKSTLLLQLSDKTSKDGYKVLYVSGEESARQTKVRADRLGAGAENLYILSEVNLEVIKEEIRKLSPRIVIIDSIQMVYRPDLTSAPGSVTQVRESAAELTYLAKAGGFSLFLIGHLTKGGSIAGPRVLEHIVDTVLYFEGEIHTNFMVLRAVKNRFGSTNEIGIFEMTEKGLRGIKSPSEALLSERPQNVPGSAVVPVLEGTRPLFVEVQALVSPSSLAFPRRRCMGIDYNRALLLLAVLEKRAGLDLSKQDVFMNIAGGVKVTEPAADLGMAVAIASSLRDLPVSQYDLFLGEVGLTGEIRGVGYIEKRLSEAKKLGFKRCIAAEGNLKGRRKLNKDIEIIGVGSIKEMLKTTLSQM